MKPACMSPEEHAAWSDANERLWMGKALTPCSDCVMSFALEQRAAGTCDGEPGVQPPPPLTQLQLSARGVAVLKSRRGEQVRRARDYAGQGHSQAAIARLMGVGRSTVSRYLRDATAA